jgi:hypothetical protein
MTQLLGQHSASILNITAAVDTLTAKVDRLSIQLQNAAPAPPLQADPTREALLLLTQAITLVLGYHGADRDRFLANVQVCDLCLVIVCFP